MKSNLGHLESAAGAASLAKVALSLRNNAIPPSINYAGPNPYIDFDGVHLKVADTVSEWPRYSGHAIAGCPGSVSAAPTRTWCSARCCPRICSSRNPSRSLESADSPLAAADAVYVGGVRMDEYGEFIGDDGDGAGYGDSAGYGDVAIDGSGDEQELPGLTDEALRLLEVARGTGRGPGGRAAHSGCAAGGLGFPDVQKAGGGRRIGGLDRQPGRPGVLVGVHRPRAVASQPRPFPRGGDGP